jgi:hypothetical protein
MGIALAEILRSQSLPQDDRLWGALVGTMDHQLSTLSDTSWPDGIDLAVTASYVAMILGLTVAGYVFMALDVRAYLRSLRRALVLVSHYRVELPAWVRRDSPRCITALGLTLPCTADDVLAAYRQKVKLLHPDRGGSRHDFLRLQQHFEQAMGLVAESGCH